jgi:hypothetical protein
MVTHTSVASGPVTISNRTWLAARACISFMLTMASAPCCWLPCPWLPEVVPVTVMGMDRLTPPVVVLEVLAKTSTRVAVAAGVRVITQVRTPAALVEASAPCVLTPLTSAKTWVVSALVCTVMVRFCPACTVVLSIWKDKMPAAACTVSGKANNRTVASVAANNARFTNLNK